MRDYIILNGVNSNTITGLLISKLPPISKPKIRTQTEEIDGRDGDIVTKLGYSAYDKEIEIGLYGDFDIDEVIAYFNSEGTITFSNEPDKYYKYEILDQINFNKLIRFKTATVRLHVQPFKYPLEETPVEINIQNVTNEAEEMDLDNTADAPMQIDLKGNTSQANDPTPEAPVEVEVVSGDNTIKVEGENKFSTDYKTSDNLTTYTKVNNNSFSFTCSGTWKGAIFTIPCEKNTDYYLNYKDSGSVSTYCQIKGVQTDTTLMNAYNGYFTSFNTGENTSITINIGNGNHSDMTSGTISNIMLNKGTTSSPYTPYVSQIYPINLGVENLFDLTYMLSNQYNANGNSITAKYTLSNDVVSISDSVSVSGRYFFNKILLNAGTYTMSFKASLSGTDKNVRYSVRDMVNLTDVVSANDKTITNGNTYNFSFTLSETTTISISLQPKVNNGGTLSLLNLQLEKGSKANSYTPHGVQPIELCKIGDYQDKIYKNNGKWYLNKQIGKVVLDGSENWDNSGTSGTEYRNACQDYQSFIKGTESASTNPDIFCNRYTKKTSNQTYTKNQGMSISTIGTIEVYDNVYNTSNLNLFKTWLSNNNVELYHVLKTPTYEEITDTTLLSQLNLIEKAKSYDTSTHITQNANKKPFILNATAVQKGTDTAVVDNEGNIYSKPTLDIEGSGNIEVYLENNQMFSIDLTNSSEIIIDTANLEAYDPSTSALMNRQVTGDYSNFKLNTGENTIKVSGNVTKATISNYTRWL